MIEIILATLASWLLVALLKIIYRIPSISHSLMSQWQSWSARFNRNENRAFRKIDKMNGDQFEQYIASLLKQSGFTYVEVTRAQGDQGIDVIATKNREKYGFQCKRWRKNVGNGAIQEAYAGQGYYKLDHAVVVTNSAYTASAKRLAEELNIQLIDRDALGKWIRR